MLLGLLRGHREQIVADLHRYYGVSLSRVRQVMPLGEFASCILNLPPESATMRAANPDAQITAEAFHLNRIEHGIRVLAWQRTPDGQSQHPKRFPERLPLTAAEHHEAEKRAIESNELKPDLMSREEMARRLGWTNI